jgi:hypothetical protein
MSMINSISRFSRVSLWTLIFFGGTLAILTAGASTAPAWTISTIDSSGDVGRFSSITIDSNNKVHISYFDNIAGDLKYTNNTSGSWETFTIDSAWFSGTYSSIATDSDNKVHISYRYSEPMNSGLRYATNASGFWVTSIPDNLTGLGGGVTSIAVDSNSEVHICYFDDSNIDLKYTTNTTGSWEMFTIDSSGNVAPGVSSRSIAVDSNNKVHIGYYDATNGDLKYATNVSGSWETLLIDTMGDVGWFSSIAIDSNNKAHISYYDQTNGDLKYATNASGSWVATTIDSAGDVGTSLSIAIDTNDRVYISYFDNTDADLKYATNASGSWVTTTVDSVGYVGPFNSIAIDSNNKIHISYFDLTNGDLKCAANAQFTLTISKSGTGVGTLTSNPAGIDCGVDCSELYEADTVVILTATPDTRSVFAGWTGDPDCSDGTVTMDGNKTCIATFNSLQSTLTVNRSDLGTATVASAPLGIDCGLDCSELYNADTVVTLTATPDSGSFLRGWTGCTSSQGGRCIVTTDMDQTVRANFEAINFGGFNDVSIGYWADDYIYAIYQIGVTLGCGGGNYCPPLNVTREQMASFIVRAVDGTDATTCLGTIFGDVPQGAPHCANIERLSALNITQGCTPGMYCPSNNVLRDQMAAFLARAFLGMQ